MNPDQLVGGDGVFKQNSCFLVGRKHPLRGAADSKKSQDSTGLGLGFLGSAESLFWNPKGWVALLKFRRLDSITSWEKRLVYLGAESPRRPRLRHKGGNLRGPKGIHTKKADRFHPS